MHPFYRCAMGLACALALSPAVAVAQPSDAAALDRELDAAIARYHLPGLAVGVAVIPVLSRLLGKGH